MPSRKRRGTPAGAPASAPVNALQPSMDQELSPSQRYAAAKARTAMAATEVARFADTLDFPLDPFQSQACESLEADRSVLVAAPTGAGKTVVGEFAVHLALSHGTKAFYTTPIKALSNQKYAEFAARHGHERVGLLTGDTSINSEAEVVVMTTEVLRNMLYAGSSTLTGLEYVIMDEVHYLADKDRGAVWEEVILQLPDTARLVSLSATVSNAEEFGGWLDTVRGATDVIVSEHRPVPLWQHVLVGDELVDLFADDVSFDAAADQTATVNPELSKLAGQSRGPAPRGQRDQRMRGRGGRNRSGRDRGRDRRRALPMESSTEPVAPRAASRPRTVEALDDAGLLPAIVFVFSRKGCEAAVAQCVRYGLRLTTAAEEAQIEEVLAASAARLPAEDLEVVGYWPWREGLLRGIASHHAGLLPVFKEAVEQLFARGLVKVVYATETLALGVNMPARSVVLEKLDKFNGSEHAPITPGEYTQLTGRAGRRGIDVEGHAVVAWHAGLDPVSVAGLASRRTYPLNSSFRPTYNMSLNLLKRLGSRRARDVLEQSFAQYQADASVVGLARELQQKQESLSGYQDAMHCHLGDFSEYDALRQELSIAQKTASRHRARARRSSAEMALESLHRGDVIELGTGKRGSGPVVVVEPPRSLRQPQATVVTLEGRQRRIGAQELDGPVDVLAQVRIAKHVTGRTPEQRRDLAASLRNALRDRPAGESIRSTAGFSHTGSAEAEVRVEKLERALRRHPCHGCPDREQHARWASRHRTLNKDVERLRSRITGRTHSIARTFDRVLAVLEAVGYVSGRGEQRHVTDAGTSMLRLYGERDLLSALVLGDGGLDGLSPAALASAATLFVYQPKRDTEGLPRQWPQGVKRVWDSAVTWWSRLEDLEHEHKVEPTPAPDATLVTPMHRWACGEDLTASLEDVDVAAGDFVRWAKQTIDFLGQLAQNPAVEPHLADTAAASAELIRRGVVAASTVVTTEPETTREEIL
ncbi:MAG: DEAD/DEAH box helicase [Galactobacter sp.]|uniref:DEAD/DEAH box helicase n=1 Tax=Galactobacter sp. TaxID=2676125 RepID=UPI0025B7DB84|nr:DEAD/DEAH box helicase [Galactobacter sp.]